MAIDQANTKNSLFGGLKKDPVAIQQEQQNKEVEKLQETIAPIQNSQLPKWKNLDKVTALLTTEQKEGLDRVAKKIMKFRSKGLKGKDSKERITANTLIRALIENFLKMENELQLEILTTEDETIRWIEKIFRLTTNIEIQSQQYTVCHDKN